MFSLVPSRRKSCRQNVDMNPGSRSETIFVGIPCRRKTCRWKSLAKSLAVIVCVVGSKIAILVSKSQNTTTTSKDSQIRKSVVEVEVEVPYIEGYI